jgi:hypothetical protein
MLLVILGLAACGEPAKTQEGGDPSSVVGDWSGTCEQYTYTYDLELDLELDADTVVGQASMAGSGDPLTGEAVGSYVDGGLSVDIVFHDTDEDRQAAFDGQLDGDSLAGQLLLDGEVSFDCALAR